MASSSSSSKQLFFMGDSQLVRMLNCELFHSHEVHNWAKAGSTTREVLDWVKHQVRTSGIRIRRDAVGIIWVGTNDVLNNIETDFNANFKKLVIYSKRIFCKLVLVQLPPIWARLHHVGTIHDMNTYIESFKGSEKIRILDLFQFCFKDGNIVEENFETTMGAGVKIRQDRIHLNPGALVRIGAMLESFLY
uniref:Uncharacterized protein n=1 Tax=Cacopsylla melanoneura TaxID=428564 RepID=A0A8D8ZCN0_9HEMI